MLASLLDNKSDCIYRCTYQLVPASERGHVISDGLSSKRNSCTHPLLSATLTISSKKGSSGSKFGWFGGEVGGEIDGVSSLKLFERRSTAMSGQRYLYTIPQAAERLSVSRQTIYGLIGSGELLAVYPTTAARISEASLSAFVRNLEERARREVKARRGQFV